MKLKYLLTLPILATALIGCDKIEESDAMPTINPQLPGILETDFTVTNLYASLTDGVGFDLEALSDALDGDDELMMLEKYPLFTINVNTTNLESGVSVGSLMQLYKQDDVNLENPYTLPIEAEEEIVEGRVVSSTIYTTLYDLIQMRQEMYDDDAWYNISYQIYVSLDYNNGQYLYGPYVKGSFPENGLPVSSNGAAIYLRGGMNDWGTPVTSEFIVTDNENVYVLPYIEIGAGVEFKVADEDWGPINLGGTQPVEPGVAYELVDGGGNLSFTSDFIGAFILTATETGWTLLPIEFVADPTAPDVYLRGGMNDWGSPAEDMFTPEVQGHLWYLENTTIEKGIEFKVADSDWRTINYGTNDQGAFDETTGTGILYLDYNAGNISLKKNFTGALRFILFEANNVKYAYLVFILA